MARRGYRLEAAQHQLGRPPALTVMFGCACHIPIGLTKDRFSMLGATVASVADTENEITADLIAELLREQHPDLADLPLTFGARGWDNQLWRLGDDLAVRLPWATQDADELLLKEHTLLPAIAPRLPIADTCSAASRPAFRAVPAPLDRHYLGRR
jgi:hypothetical protein